MLDNVEPCVSFQQLRCDADEYIKFLTTNMQSKCQFDCPLECGTQEFQLSLSSAAYPSDGYASYLLAMPEVMKHFNTTPSNDELRAQILSLNVYYGCMV